MDGDKLKQDLTRRIPRQWRGDIKIDSVEQLASSNGRPAGTTVAIISSRSRLGREQAMLSLGPYLANETEDWSRTWKSRQGRWIFVGYEPSNEPQQPTIFDFAAQLEDSAASNS